MKALKIDYTNHEQLCDLMDHADEYPTMLMGENENGEFVTTSIYNDRVVWETSQANGWVRTNTAYRDGTVDETFRKEDED